MGLVYRIFLPPISASDVVKRVLDHSVDGVSSTINVDISSKYIDLPPVKQSSNIIVKLKDIDDADNESDWSAPLSFTAKDTIIPPAPGGLSTKLLAEVPDPPAEVVPEPTPVVDPEPETPLVDTSQPLAFFKSNKYS